MPQTQNGSQVTGSAATLGSVMRRGEVGSLIPLERSQAVGKKGTGGIKLPGPKRAGAFPEVEGEKSSVAIGHGVRPMFPARLTSGVDPDSVSLFPLESRKDGRRTRAIRGLWPGYWQESVSRWRESTFHTTFRYVQTGQDTQKYEIVFLMEQANSLTSRIQEFMRGDSSEVDELFHEIMPELFRVAARELKKNERRLSPVTKTELIGELWVRHLARRGWTIKDRHHFYALAGQAMRHVLCDLARARFSVTRGGGAVPLPLESAEASGRMSIDDDRQTVEIGLIVERIQRDAPDVAQVIDLYYFCGFTLPEVSERLGISPRKARTLWNQGKDRVIKDLLLAQRLAAKRSLTMGAAKAVATRGLFAGSNS